MVIINDVFKFYLYAVPDADRDLSFLKGNILHLTYRQSNHFMMIFDDFLPILLLPI